MISVPTTHDVRLTAPEIAALWSQYQNDTMARCVYKYMLNIVEDASIRPILQFALQLAESHIPTIRRYFSEEQFPIPRGFTEADVNLEAPRLFSDEACLTYTYSMSINALILYAGALATSMRKDVREYFLQCQSEAVSLFNQALDLLLEKGFISKPPFVYPSKTVEFVEKPSVFKGWFGRKRPLNCLEVTHIFWDLRKVQISKSFTMAFAQTAKSKEVREFLWRGVQMYAKQIEVLESTLAQNQLPQPKSEEAEITNSLIAPFSDRLMMHHKTLMDSTILSLYGSAIGLCGRADLTANYMGFMQEIVRYMEDAADLMIKHKWLEQPPMAEDREALATKK